MTLDSTSKTDSLVRSAFRAALAEIEAQGHLGKDVRERKHLDPAVKQSFRQLGVSVTSEKLQTPLFPGLGPVDVIVTSPAIFIELKWSYKKRSKIFESVWDAIKLAILAGERGGFGYVATGASQAAWGDCECADLFDEPEVDPHELWVRPLCPPGPNGGSTVGEDLILGSPSESRPKMAPQLIAVERVAQYPYPGDYEMKVIRVSESGSMRAWD